MESEVGFGFGSACRMIWFGPIDCSARENGSCNARASWINIVVCALFSFVVLRMNSSALRLIRMTLPAVIEASRTDDPCVHLVSIERHEGLKWRV